MTIKPDDPKLTAFVLGELAEEERLEVQAALDADPELREEVEAIRRMTDDITAAMQTESLPGNTPSTAKNAHKPETNIPQKHPNRWGSLVPLLVVVSIIGMLAGLLLPGVQPARESGGRKYTEHESSFEISKILSAEAAKPIDDAPLRYTFFDQENDTGTIATNRNVPVDRALPSSSRFGLSAPESVLNAARPPVASDEAGAHGGSISGSVGLTQIMQGQPAPVAPKELKEERGRPSNSNRSSAIPADSAPMQDGDRRSDTIHYGGSVVGGIAVDQSGVLAGSSLAKEENSNVFDLPFRQEPMERIEAAQEGKSMADGRNQSTSEQGFQVNQPAIAEGSPLPTEAGEKSRRGDHAFGRRPMSPQPTGEADYIVSKKVYETKTSNGRVPEESSRKRAEDASVPQSGPVLGIASRPIPVSPYLKEKEDHAAIRDGMSRDPYDAANAEAYKNFAENEFLRPQDAPFSTFSIDVDSAAYATMRRFVLRQNRRPPADSVRLEEYINYFRYDYAAPVDDKPFATHIDVARCPWEPKHLLARIGIKGKEYSAGERPPLNLVFLVDTSGSMQSSNRLPLVQKGLTELVEMLQDRDRVAIVTYAGSSELALPSVSGREKRAILDVVNSLTASGSTAGAEGIKTAYETARKYYDKAAQNRVILCTDGDFNVGTTNNKTLERMIGDEARSGVFLTVLGFGMGNYKDERLKTLSMRGNGNYGYIDSPEEVRRLLVEGLTGTLFTIAKDVKIQVDFNPKRVGAYRLLGYENRKLQDEDFHNDKVDAGDIGAGHTVTALYEIIPAGVAVPQKVDESRYAEKTRPESGAETAESDPGEFDRELMFVKLRYKQPDADKSSLLEYPVTFAGVSESDVSPDWQFAAAVALYGMLLRESRFSGHGTFDDVLELASPNTKDDRYRKEFVDIVRKAKEVPR